MLYQEKIKTSAESNKMDKALRRRKRKELLDKG